MSAVAKPSAASKFPIKAGIGGLTSILLIAIFKTVGVVIVLAFLGVPLFALMGVGAAWGWTHLADQPDKHYISMIANDVLKDEFAGSEILVTIPLFTFVGYLMAESKTPERIVRASRAFLGWMPAGLALVCIWASAFFTTLTGASGVTIIAIGGLLYPSLRKQRYPDDFSLGLVTAGGSLGLLWPPSLPILVYSIVANLPQKELFKAGLLPGMVVLVFLWAYAAYVSIKAQVAREKFEPKFLLVFLFSPLIMCAWDKEARAAFWAIKWELLIPLIILGGLFTGLTSLGETAAIAALYTLIVEVWVYGDLSFRKDLPRIAKNSMSLAGAVILILAMANALIGYITTIRLPDKLLEWLSTGASLDASWKFLIGLNIFLLIIGMLMDGFSAILVSVPLIIPIAATFRMNPFHVAMIFLLNLELAFLCPPLGLNLFISSFRFERPVVSLYRIVLPFVGLLVIALALVTYFPRISTYLLERQVANEGMADIVATMKCVRPNFTYDKLSCVQSDPLNSKPCNARSELLHCLSAPSEESDEYQNYCVKAYEKTCLKHGWKDKYEALACTGAVQSDAQKEILGDVDPFFADEDQLKQFVQSDGQQQGLLMKYKSSFPETNQDELKQAFEAGAKEPPKGFVKEWFEGSADEFVAAFVPVRDLSADDVAAFFKTSKPQRSGPLVAFQVYVDKVAVAAEKTRTRRFLGEKSEDAGPPWVSTMTWAERWKANQVRCNGPSTPEPPTTPVPGTEPTGDDDDDQQLLKDMMGNGAAGSASGASSGSPPPASSDDEDQLMKDMMK